MPLGYYGTPMYSSYSTPYLSGPYSNHSSIIAANYIRSPSNTYTKALPRIRSSFTPLLATISEAHAAARPMTRTTIPKLVLHSSPKFKMPRPISINTADIDVSVNKYRKFKRTRSPEKYQITKPKEYIEKKIKTTTKEEDEEALLNKAPIRRDRPTVRLHTIHRNSKGKETERKFGRRWRDAFEEDDEPVKVEKRVEKSTAEKLLEKHLIKDKTEEEKLRLKEDEDEEPRNSLDIKEGNSLEKSPSFHDICESISWDKISEDLNPGQPEHIKRRQTRQLSTDDILKQIRRDSAEILQENVILLDKLIKNDGLDKPLDEVNLDQSLVDNKTSGKRKQKIYRKKTSKNLIIEPEELINKSMLQRRLTQKKIRRSSTDKSLPSPLEVDQNFEQSYQETIRDISQVEVEEIKIKPKPVITATVDIESTKPNLKIVVVDDVEIVETPTYRSPKYKLEFTIEEITNEETQPELVTNKVEENSVDDFKEKKSKDEDLSYKKVVGQELKNKEVKDKLQEDKITQKGPDEVIFKKEEKKKEVVRVNKKAIEDKESQVSKEEKQKQILDQKAKLKEDILKQKSKIEKLRRDSLEEKEKLEKLIKSKLIKSDSQEEKEKAEILKKSQLIKSENQEEKQKPEKSNKSQLIKSDSQEDNQKIKKSNNSQLIKSDSQEEKQKLEKSNKSQLIKSDSQEEKEKAEILKKSQLIKSDNQEEKQKPEKSNKNQLIKSDSQEEKQKLEKSNKSQLIKSDSQEEKEKAEILKKSQLIKSDNQEEKQKPEKSNKSQLIKSDSQEEKQKLEKSNKSQLIKSDSQEEKLKAENLKKSQLIKIEEIQKLEKSNKSQLLKSDSQEEKLKAENLKKSQLIKSDSQEEKQKPEKSNKSQLIKSDSQEEKQKPEKSNKSQLIKSDSREDKQKPNLILELDVKKKQMKEKIVENSITPIEEVQKPKKIVKALPPKEKIVQSQPMQIPQTNQPIIAKVLTKKPTKHMVEILEEIDEPKPAKKPKPKTKILKKPTQPASPQEKIVENCLPQSTQPLVSKVLNKNNAIHMVEIKDEIIEPKPIVKKVKKEVPTPPEVKEENKVQKSVSTDSVNFWEDIETRETVQFKNRKNEKPFERLSTSPEVEENNNIPLSSTKEETKEVFIRPKKITSKRSLVVKANINDPDLQVFVPPEEEPNNEEKNDKPEKFVPLQSNRMSDWMHPFQKPVQLEVCPVERFATPKVIRFRHYPRPRHPPPNQPPPLNDNSESDSSESEESSSDEEESDISEDETNASSTQTGTSTSSNDSGFDSSAPGSPSNRRYYNDCDVNCHKKCEKLTANLCGVNQKLIVEAIASVRKGSSENRDSPSSNPALNPAFAVDSGDVVSEDLLQSSTFAGYQKSGRITPPATTMPRFRKYTIDDFQFLKVLGKGSFGKVMLAELKNTEYYYAVKCLKKDVVLEDDDVECTLIERKVLALGTKHPYLCHLLCTFQTESHLFFVMEYLNGGDLMFHIQQSGRFDEPRARFYAAEIASGLKFLHSKGIVYRDLKLDNILLDFDGHVRIADFGMCKLQIFLDRTADTFCGTPDYMAPEIIKGQHYNQCVDWWSYGVLLYEMLIGQSPFSGCDEDELFWSICNEKPLIPRFLSEEANTILLLLLEKDANKRLGHKFCPSGIIQDQPFFKAICWDRLEARLLEPPFKPKLQHPLDTQYFDRTFTVERAKLTPIEKNILQSMDQTQFQGFSYTNPNATDK